MTNPARFRALLRPSKNFTSKKVVFQVAIDQQIAAIATVAEEMLRTDSNPVSAICICGFPAGRLETGQIRRVNRSRTSAKPKLSFEVKVGNVVVKIYRSTRRERVLFTVA